MKSGKAHTCNLLLRPDWVNIYLADSSGNSKGSGPSLITGIEDENNDVNIPNDFVTAGNYPNPFNPNDDYLV